MAFGDAVLYYNVLASPTFASALRCLYHWDASSNSLPSLHLLCYLAMASVVAASSAPAYPFESHLWLTVAAVLALSGFLMAASSFVLNLRSALARGSTIAQEMDRNGQLRRQFWATIEASVSLPAL